MRLAGSEKSWSRRRLRSTSRPKEALLLTSTAALLGRCLAWPRAPGLGWCKHRDRRDAAPEDEDDGQQANQSSSKEPCQDKQPRSQAGAPARQAHFQGRPKSAPTQASSAAGPAAVAPEGASERIALATNTPPSPEPQASPSKPRSKSTDLATTRVPGGDRPRASTKRAVLIGMLERAEGASVAEIGQRLGWLPHTVRAAITGLRHAGREVTRSKDGEGRSVYRLAAPETVSR